MKKTITIGSSAVLLIAAALWAADTKSQRKPNQPFAPAVDKGARWLVSVQGADGGWGQDGGETSYIRVGERVESNGNDVANTAVAALALLEAGTQYRPNAERAINFILQRVEASNAEGLSITNVTGTQIQRKLGPYIDTFLTSRLLSQVDGTFSNPAMNARVRRALEKCVAKIQQNQQSDGSWNISGGWAPVLGTSLASRSLFEAQRKGVKVENKVMARADDYAKSVVKAAPATAGGAGAGRYSVSSTSESAGVALYQSGQALEQLSRTEKDRENNAPRIAALQAQLSDGRFVDGFGSVGGEEFFSYLNISDGMKRAGGPEWTKWHSGITQKIVALQNNDGTWAGHHCITGRVAVTSAAMLNLTVDRAN